MGCSDPRRRRSRPGKGTRPMTSKLSELLHAGFSSLQARPTKRPGRKCISAGRLVWCNAGRPRRTTTRRAQRLVRRNPDCVAGARSSERGRYGGAARAVRTACVTRGQLC
jgi:hypothetical protein